MNPGENDNTRLMASMAARKASASRASRCTVGARVEVRFGIPKASQTDRGRMGYIVALGSCSAGPTATVALDVTGKNHLVFVDQLMPFVGHQTSRPHAAFEARPRLQTQG